MTGVAKAWVISGVTTGVVFGLGMVGLVALMVVLNGFSEQAAAPFFIAYLAALTATNAGIVALVSSMVLRGLSDSARRRRSCAWNAIAFTALPWLVFAALTIWPRAIE